jgi:hypothetical protein
VQIGILITASATALQRKHRSILRRNDTSAAVSLDAFGIKIYKSVLNLLYFVNGVDCVPVAAVL